MSFVLKVRCSTGVGAQCADLLWQIGCTGIAEVDHPDATTDLLVGFDGPIDVAAVRAALVGVGTDVLEVTRTESVAPTWREHAEPVAVGPFHLRFPEHVPAPADVIDLVIDPGEAFGSGSHASTRLALEALADLDLDGRTVADIGCGTGVLAIAAHHLGAAVVDAVDIDPAAVEASRRNFAYHAIPESVELGSAGDLPGPRYDVIVANLTIDNQREIAPAVAERVAPRGVVVLSGILGAQVDDALARYAGFGLVTRRDDGEWACLTLSRSAG